MKLQERFQMDAKLSYADFHHSITQNIENIPSGGSSDYERSPKIEMDSNDDDELVKYMSTLPAFLRKVENIPEKAFSVGVLDLGHLEKWQSSHKQILPRSTRYSTSCSSATSALSADSSNNSSRARSCSPIEQRMNQQMRQSHLPASPKGGDSHPFDPLSDNREKCTHNVDVRRNKFQGKILSGEIVESKNNEVVSCNWSHPAGVSREGGKKVLETKLGSRSELFQVARCPFTEPEIEEKPNNVVILVPRDVSKPNVSESPFAQLSDSLAKTGKKPVKMSRRGLSENVTRVRAESVRGVHGSKFHSEIPSPTSLEANLCKQPQMKCHSSMVGANLKSERPRQLHPLTRVGVSQSAVGTLQTGKPNALDSRLLGGSDFNAKTSSEKPRSSSPLRRLGHSLTKIVKNSSSKDGYLGAHYDSRKSGCEKADDMVCQDTSVCDRSNSAMKSRSSPLRRLLDPILKPKTPDSHNCDNTLPKSSISSDVGSRQAAGHAKAMNLQSAKKKLDIPICSTIHVNETWNRNNRFESVSVQALLRVASKNGLPLLTFAVDNESDVLAATIKNDHSSGKNSTGWMYTFFTVHEVRKKNGNWITQGAKSKTPNYVPNVVAHMKVSDVELHTSQHLEEHSTRLREFVLLGIDTVQQEQSIQNFQPHDELAAIVTTTPVPERQFPVQFSGVPHTWEHLKDQRSFVNGSKNTTVILPSGIHSLPSSGGPSSLIERWRSGGSCDCRGWDEGCKLRILSSNNSLESKPSYAEASLSEDSFSLFSQADARREEHSVFSLTPFKDKIYSVEFKSSLSVLQAFSMCIAVLDSRQLIDSMEPSKLYEVKPHVKLSQQQDGDAKLPKHAHISTGNIVCSPAGRAIFD